MRTIRRLAKLALAVVTPVESMLRGLAWRDAELDHYCRLCRHEASLHGSATDGPCGTSPNDVRWSCIVSGCGCLAMTPPMRFYRDRAPHEIISCSS